MIVLAPLSLTLVLYVATSSSLGKRIFLPVRSNLTTISSRIELLEASMVSVGLPDVIVRKSNEELVQYVIRLKTP